jgi:hypothetical protein
MGVKTGIAVAAILLGMSVPAIALEARYVAGAWKNPAGGSCDPAFFKSGDLTQTKRGEPAITGTVSNAGITVTGLLILDGARRGQMVSPDTDKAILLFDERPGGKLRAIAIGEPVLSWPTVVLDLCPGSKPK